LSKRVHEFLKTPLTENRRPLRLNLCYCRKNCLAHLPPALGEEHEATATPPFGPALDVAASFKLTQQILHRLFGHAGSSALAKLSEAIAKTLADPASVKRLTDIGAGVPKPERQGGTYMQRLVISEVDRWRKILVDVKVGE
jgi:hypothetical protein